MGLLSEDYSCEVAFCRRFILRIQAGYLYKPCEPLPVWYCEFMNSGVLALPLLQAAMYFKEVVVRHNTDLICKRFNRPISEIQIGLQLVHAYRDNTKHEYQIIADVPTSKTEISVLYSFTIEHNNGNTESK